MSISPRFAAPVLLAATAVATVGIGLAAAGTANAEQARRPDPGNGFGSHQVGRVGIVRDIERILCPGMGMRAPQPKGPVTPQQ